MIFHEVTKDSFYVGGEPRDKFVRIEVVHIARTNEIITEQLGISIEELLSSYFVVDNQVLKPYVADPGYEVEFHVETAPCETWQVAGRTPSPPESEAETRWYEGQQELALHCRRTDEHSPDTPA